MKKTLNWAVAVAPSPAMRLSPASGGVMTGTAACLQSDLGVLGFARRGDLHLLRKSWHFLMGMLIVTLYQTGRCTREQGIRVLLFFLALNVSSECLRLRYPSFNLWILKFWGPLIRRHEVQTMSAIPQYLLAALLMVSCFPKAIAVLSLLYLAVGDPVASLCGILWGHLGPRFSFAPDKSMVGTAASIVVCIALSWIYLGVMGVNTFWVGFLGGMVGGTAELVPLGWDDNFTIPVISGVGLWFLFQIFGLAL